MAPNQIAFYPQSSGGAGLPAASAAGQVPTSTGAGTTYTAQVPAVTLISEQVLASPAATVTFPSIPQTFKHLKLVIAASGASVGTILMEFNGDATAGNYFWNTLTQSFATSSNVTTGGFSSAAGAPVGLANSGSNCGASEISMPGYTDATRQKTYTGMGLGAAFVIFGGIWNSTAAVTQLSLTISGAVNFTTGSTFSLYGLN